MRKKEKKQSERERERETRLREKMRQKGGGEKMKGGWGVKREVNPSYNPENMLA